MQFVACVSTRLRKLRAMFGLMFLLNGGIESNDIALSIPAGLMCYMRLVVYV